MCNAFRSGDEARRQSCGGANEPSALLQLLIARRNTVSPRLFPAQFETLDSGTLGVTTPGSMPRNSAIAFKCVLSRRFDEFAIAQHIDLLAREDLEQPGQLLAVLAEFESVARTGAKPCEIRFDSRRQAVRKSALGLEAISPEMGPLRVGAIDGIADHSDQLRRAVRRCQKAADTAMGGSVPEVERSALYTQRAGRCTVEQRLVSIAPPQPFLRAVRISRPLLAAPVRSVAVGKEVLRLLWSGEETTAGAARAQRAGPLSPPWASR